MLWALRKRLRITAVAFPCAALIVLAPFSGGTAHAVPSFERQTGMECAECHTVFPELTALGRDFKLRGYIPGKQLETKRFPASLPLSAAVIGSRTSVDSTRASDPEEDFPRDDEVVLQTAAVYYGGRIAELFGALVQYGYDGLERNWAMEMVDVRHAGATTVNGAELLYGLTLNNAPTTQDVWNSSPVWGFPHLSDAGVTPTEGALLDLRLARAAGGLGVYGLWAGILYTELSFYRTTKRGLLQPLRKL